MCSYAVYSLFHHFLRGGVCMAVTRKLPDSDFGAENCRIVILEQGFGNFLHLLTWGEGGVRPKITINNSF